MFRKVASVAVMVVALVTLGQVDVFAKQVIRVGLGDPIDSEQGALAKRFKKIVEEGSNGDIEVKLFPHGALGSETEMLQNTRMGTLDLSIIGLANAVPFVKELATLTMPYLIENTDEAVKATTGRLGEHWDRLAVKKGRFHIVGWAYSDFRYLTNSKRAVRNLKDVKGLKVRVPMNKIMMATFDSWGAQPIPVAWPKTYKALEEKEVDGQANSYITSYTSKFHEVQNHLTEVHFEYSLQAMIMGDRTFVKLDKKTRELVLRAGIQAQQDGISYLRRESSKAKSAMKAAGVTVSTLSDEERWKSLAIENVWPKFYGFIGGKQNLDLVLDALGKS